jgi:hypothetical protein
MKNDNNVDFVLRVTAADFNGKDFDGTPLEVISDCDDQKVIQQAKQLEKEGRFTINLSGDTDYAKWNVKTSNGIVVAEPGDVISYLGGVLTVQKYETGNSVCAK